MIPTAIPPVLKDYLAARLSQLDLAMFEALWATEAQKEALANYRVRKPPSPAAMLRRMARKLDKG